MNDGLLSRGSGHGSAQTELLVGSSASEGYRHAIRGRRLHSPVGDTRVCSLSPNRPRAVDGHGHRRPARGAARGDGGCHVAGAHRRAHGDHAIGWTLSVSGAAVRRVSLTFTLAHFQILVRAGIGLSLATTITVDSQLSLADLQESVVVTAATPVVDVATTKVGVNLKGDPLVGVPNSTDIWGVLSESPGIRMQGFDVGGSHKSAQSGYEVFGIQDQSRIISEGVDHTEGVGGTGFYEDYFANEEVSVSALGSDVEMNGGGAAIVTTIKSGGNTFKGLYQGTYEQVAGLPTTTRRH